jgi:hypothetical protein
MPRLGVLPPKEPHTEAQVNRRGTMNKLKMLVLAALAAATVGTGALAAAQSASAAAPKQQRAKVASTAERPKICFVFGPWKYCI